MGNQYEDFMVELDKLIRNSQFRMAGDSFDALSAVINNAFEKVAESVKKSTESVSLADAEVLLRAGQINAEEFNEYAAYKAAAFRKALAAEENKQRAEANKNMFID